MNLYSADNIRTGIHDFMLGRMFAAFFSFAVNILLVRILVEEDYANYVTLTGLQLTLLLAVSLGLERAVARFASEGAIHWPQDRLVKLLCGALSLRVLLLVLIALILTLTSLSDWLEQAFHLQDWQQVALAFWIYTITFGFYTLLQIMAQCFMLQSSIRTSLSIQWGLRFLLVLAMVLGYGSLNLIEVLWVFALTATMSCLVLIIPIRNHVLCRPTKIDNETSYGYDAHPIVRLAWHNYLEKLSSLPTSAGFLRLLAANVLPTMATASYGFYQMLASVIQRYMPTSMAQGMLEPAVAGRYAAGESTTKLGAILSIVFKVNLIVLAPILAWLAVSGEDFVSLLTGGKYVDTAWVLVLLSFSLVPGSLWQILIAYTNAISRSEILAGTSVLTALWVIPLAWAVKTYPEHGLLLLASAVPLLGTFQAILALVRLKKLGQSCRLDFIGAARVVMAAVLSASLAWLLLYHLELSTQILRIFVSSGVIALSFAILCFQLKVLGNQEIDMLARLSPHLAKFLNFLKHN